MSPGGTRHGAGTFRGREQHRLGAVPLRRGPQRFGSLLFLRGGAPLRVSQQRRKIQDQRQLVDRQGVNLEEILRRPLRDPGEGP